MKREPPDQIDAEFGKDYTSKPDKSVREPFMAPGGWWVLISFAFMLTIYILAGRWLHGIIDPAVDWMLSGG